MKTMTDILNDELDSIMAHCMDVCDSESFDDVALAGSDDLHDEHVFAFRHQAVPQWCWDEVMQSRMDDGDLLTDMDADDLIHWQMSW